MSWFKIDDKFPDSPKVDGLSDAAHRLWVDAGCWCRKPENLRLKGFVPASALGTITRRRWSTEALAEAVAELVDARIGGTHEFGLWEVCDNGWKFHNWEKYQPDEPLTAAEISRRGGLKSAEVRRERLGTATPINARNHRSDTEALRSTDVRSAFEATEAPDPDPDPILPSEDHRVVEPPQASAQPKLRRIPEVPVPMPTDWLPSDPLVAALAEKCQATPERIRQCVPEFRVYWTEGKGQSTKRGPKGWSLTFSKRISVMAERGELYVGPQNCRSVGVKAPKQSNSVGGFGDQLLASLESRG